MAESTTLTYSLHGCTVAVSCRSPATDGAVRAILGCFPAEQEGSSAHARLEAEDAENLRALPLPWTAGRADATPTLDAEPLRRAEDYAVYRLPEETVLVFRMGAVVQLPVDAASAAVTFAPIGREHPDFRPQVLFFALSELLKRQGLRSIHASAVERGGRVFLIAGRSGSGKSTAGLALVRSGWKLLSDDHPLVRRDEEGFEILPFPRPVGITPRTASLFPELQGLELPAGRDGKLTFPVESIYRGGQSGGGRLAHILVPRIVDMARSVLEPLRRSRALETLLPQALVALDPERSRAEFEFWADAARSVPAHLVHFGADVTDLPRHLQAAGLVD